MHPSQPPPPVPAVGPERIARNWRAITIELDAPPRSRTERMMRRFGIPDHMTRVAVATPALRRSWLIAAVVISVLGLVATDPANPRDSVFAFLLMAPLVPVIGVAMAYGTPGDPAHEIHLATPMSGLRLLLIRTLAVLATAVPLISIPALLSEVARPWAAAWLLPALAVSAGTAALITVTSPTRAAVVASVAWVSLLIVVRNAIEDNLAAFGPFGQLVSACVATVLLAIALLRRETYDRMATA